MIRFTSRVAPPPTAPREEKKHKFLFERVIERQGYYIMSPGTYKEYTAQHGRDFLEILDLLGLKAVPVPGGYKIY